MNAVRNILVLLIVLGQYSCNQKNEVSDDKPEIKIHGFEFVNDFELDKSMFNTEFFKANSYSNYNGKLTVYYSKDKNYVVLDFGMIGVDHNLHLTYWTDKDLKIKFSRATTQYLNKENTYKENGQMYAQVTGTDVYYLSYTDESIHLYDYQENEILDADLANRQKQQTEKFYNDLLEPEAFGIYTMINRK